MARKGIENGWPQKDVDPCFQYARLITIIDCNLGAAGRHLVRGDRTSANAALVLAHSHATDLMKILPATKKDAGAIAQGTEAVRKKLGTEKKIGAKDREALLGNLIRLNPHVRELYLRGHGACRKKS